MSSPEKQPPELSLGEWVKTAQPNDFFVYATARFLTDHYASRKIAIQAWKLAVEGRIYLVQRRVPYSIPSMFDYIAIKAGISPVRSLVAVDYGDPIEMPTKRKLTPIESKVEVEQVNG